MKTVDGTKLYADDIKRIQDLEECIAEVTLILLRQENHPMSDAALRVFDKAMDRKAMKNLGI